MPEAVHSGFCGATAPAVMRLVRQQGAVRALLPEPLYFHQVYIYAISVLSGEGSRVSAAVSFFAGDEFGISAFATGLAKIFLMVTIFFSTTGKVYCGSDALGAESTEDDVTEGLSAKVLAVAEDGIESEEETELEEKSAVLRRLEYETAAEDSDSSSGLAYLGFIKRISWTRVFC